MSFILIFGTDYSLNFIFPTDTKLSEYSIITR